VEGSVLRMGPCVTVAMQGASKHEQQLCICFCLCCLALITHHS
jgi:hypothetical protein